MPNNHRVHHNNHVFSLKKANERMMMEGRSQEGLDHLFDIISREGKVSKCSAQCPLMRKDGTCEAVTYEVTVGEDCQAQIQARGGV